MQMIFGGNKNKCDIIVYCRRGNDSQLAVKELRLKLSGEDIGEIRDIINGLNSFIKLGFDFVQY